MRSMYFVGLSLLLALSFSCKKDEGSSNCSKLEGRWQLESWKEDGEQFFGDTIFITSSEINFKTLVDGQGDYELNISYIIGGTEMIIGSYVVNEDCDQVTLTPKGISVGATYNFHFDGDLLILDGTINSIVMELQFRKE